VPKINKYRDILSHLKDGGGDESKKLSEIINFINNSEREDLLSLENIKQLITELNIQKLDNQEEIIKSFLSADKIEPCTSRSFKDLLDSLELKDKSQLHYGNSVGSFFKSKRKRKAHNKAFNEDDFINDVEIFGIKHDYFFVSIEYYHDNFRNRELGNEEEKIKRVEYINKLIEFTKKFYLDDEVSQYNFIKESISNCLINWLGEDSSILVKHFKTFIDDLKDKELTLSLTESFVEGLAVEDHSGDKIINILTLAQNKIKKQYSFLAEVLSEKTTLEDVIISEKMEVLREIFEGVPSDKITILNLIFYHDSVNENRTLSSMLKPEIKQILHEAFLPSAEKLLYEIDTIDKINQLLTSVDQKLEKVVEIRVKIEETEETKAKVDLEERLRNQQLDFFKGFFIENSEICDFLKAGAKEQEEKHELMDFRYQLVLDFFNSHICNINELMGGPLGSTEPVSPTDHDETRSYLLSPTALVKKLSEKILEPHDVIKEEFEEAKKQDLIMRIREEFPIDSEQKLKEIASYLIIKKIVKKEKIDDLESKIPELRKLSHLIDITPSSDPSLPSCKKPKIEQAPQISPT